MEEIRVDLFHLAEVADVPYVETVIVVDGRERKRLVAQRHTVRVLVRRRRRRVMTWRQGQLPRVDESSHVDAERVRPRETGDHLERLLSIDVYGSVGASDEQVVQVGVDAIGTLRVQLDHGTQRPRLVLELADEAVRRQCVRATRAFARAAHHITKVTVLVLVQYRRSTYSRSYIFNDDRTPQNMLKICYSCRERMLLNVWQPSRYVSCFLMLKIS